MSDKPKTKIPQKKRKDGDDPRDTPRPKIYGEEIDPKTCSPDFIMSPPPECRTQANPVPAFRGEFCYFIFPGSEWENTSPNGKLLEAQNFFEKYCMYFNFNERTLSPRKTNKYERWYAEWKAEVRQSIIPDRHIPNLRRRLTAQNTGKTPAEIDELLREEIWGILRNASIPGDLHGKFFRKMRKLQRDVAGRGCSQTLIVFIDEYICYNPKPTRTSACQLQFNQIGITAVDAGSDNVLAHEMVHLLGKPATNRGGKTTWEHEKCPNSVLHTTRSDWWRTYRFADLFTSAAYQELITNQSQSQNRLIERVT